MINTMQDCVAEWDSSASSPEAEWDSSASSPESWTQASSRSLSDEPRSDESRLRRRYIWNSQIPLWQYCAQVLQYAPCLLIKLHSHACPNQSVTCMLASVKCMLAFVTYM